LKGGKESGVGDKGRAQIFHYVQNDRGIPLTHALRSVQALVLSLGGERRFIRG
jgi:hypothetical protein